MRKLFQFGSGRRRRWGRLARVAVAALLGFAVYYETSPRKTLIIHRLLPGNWLLAIEGKNLYDPDLGILRHGNPRLPEVAITIDDGPHPENDPGLLRALKAAGARATFFVVGIEAKRHPDLIRRIVADGHEIGSHTNEHLRLPTLTDRQVRNTLRDAGINVRLASGGYRMKTLRPPGGEIDARTARIAKEMGYTTVLWTATSGDYDLKSPDAIVRGVTNGFENGAIILIHDAHKSTVEALPILLDRLKAAGFHPVTVSEMLNHLLTAEARRKTLSRRDTEDARRDTE